MTYSDKLKDPRWQKKRLKILERDNFACTVCENNTNTLHVHHIAYSENPWDTRDELLITLCEQCHQEEEAGLRNTTTNLIKTLKNAGFTASGFYYLGEVFKNYNSRWTSYDPSFSILKMIIDDNKLWNSMENLYWKRLKK